MDMGYDHLIESDSDSVSTGMNSEEEYLQLACAREDPRKRVSLWTILQEMIDIGFYSVFMGRQQLKGTWMISPYHNSDNAIFKYGYLFEEYQGLPVLYRWLRYTQFYRRYLYLGCLPTRSKTEGSTEGSSYRSD